MASRPFEGLEPGAGVGVRRARAARDLDARLGRMVGCARPGAHRIRSDAAIRACSRADRKRRGRGSEILRCCCDGQRRRSRPSPSRACSPGSRRARSHRGGLSARTDRVPADLLERDGHRVRAVRAVRFHLSASGAEPRVVRVLAAAAVPMAAVTLYLTFSRGAIWVLPVGLVLYVLCAQARGPGVRRRSPAIPAGVAVWVAYGAELLARADYDTAAAAPEARRVGLTVVACCLAAGGAACAAGLWRTAGWSGSSSRGTPGLGSWPARRGARRRRARGGRAVAGRATPSTTFTRGLGPAGGRPARPAHVAGRQRAHRALAASRWTGSARSRCTARAPGRTGSTWDRDRPPASSRCWTGTRCTSRRWPSWGSSGSCCS